MDEVLAYWVRRVIQWYNIDKREESLVEGKPWTEVTLNDIKNWDVKTNLGAGSEVYIRSYMRYPNFNRELEPIEGACDGVRSLIRDGHDVIIATAVPKCAGIAYEGKKEWLREHIPELPLDNLVAISRKDILKLDVLLDDGIHNLEAALADGIIAVAMDRPWNQSWTGPRVKNWEEFLVFIARLDDLRSGNVSA